MSEHAFLRPNRKLLFLLNPGNMSRHWLVGMIAGAKKLGLEMAWLELEALRSAAASNPGELMMQLNEIVRAERIGALINYAGNGLRDIPPVMQHPNQPRSFWEIRGIPALNVWADHPQWVGNCAALAPD